MSDNLNNSDSVIKALAVAGGLGILSTLTFKYLNKQSYHPSETSSTTATTTSTTSGKTENASASHSIAIAQFVGKLKEFKSKHEKQSSDSTITDYWCCIVGVDVGATNIRVCLKMINNPQKQQQKDNVKFSPSELNDRSEMIEVPKLKCSSTKLLVQLLERCSQSVEDVFGLSFKSKGGVLAVAGPVGASADHVKLTNYIGTDNELHVNELPHYLFPKNQTKFLNDLEACCFGIIGLSSQNRLGQYFDDAWSSDKQSDVKNIQFKNNHYAVLSVGTGLGTGLILSQTYKDALNKEPEFEVLPLEAGHCLISIPGPDAEEYENEKSRIEFLSKLVYEGEHPIEFEDVCSGRGLKACYEFESGQRASNVSVADIANENSEQSNRAMYIHYKYLMKAAQNICVMLPSCRGVLFAGDNQVTNDNFFSFHSSTLKEDFLNHPKRNWLEKVTAYRQRRKLNLNIEGTFYYLINHLCEEM